MAVFGHVNKPAGSPQKVREPAVDLPADLDRRCRVFEHGHVGELASLHSGDVEHSFPIEPHGQGAILGFRLQGKQAGILPRRDHFAITVHESPVPVIQEPPSCQFTSMECDTRG